MTPSVRVRALLAVGLVGAWVGCAVPTVGPAGRATYWLRVNSNPPRFPCYWLWGDARLA